jgi:hypothetical protein
MKILMREDKGKKWELVESNAYAAEKELQELLADSPDIISMEEIRPGAGPLVAAVREFSLPVGLIDILAFTARGDIAIVECKLAKNTQAKREVIGQIMDYAAHLWEWTYEELDQRIQAMGKPPLAELVKKYADDPAWDEEAFRANISAALEQGNFILTIAVNEINEELHKIIRYINSAGAPAFSFAALEMRRFHKANIEMLVPHVFGQIQAKVASPKAAGHKWDEETFFANLHQKDPAAELVAKQLLAWAKQHMTSIWWGEGSMDGSFVPIFLHGKQKHQLFAVWTNATVEIYFQWYQYKDPFKSEQARQEILNRLNEIEGVNLSIDEINKKPSIKLSTLSNSEALKKFLTVFEWMVAEIKKGEKGGLQEP